MYEKYQNKLLNKIKKKLKNNEKINIGFYICEITKWKSQTLYELLKNDNRFNVFLLIDFLERNDCIYLPKEERIKNYNDTISFF